MPSTGGKDAQDRVSVELTLVSTVYPSKPLSYPPQKWRNARRESLVFAFRPFDRSVRSWLANRASRGVRNLSEVRTGFTFSALDVRLRYPTVLGNQFHLKRSSSWLEAEAKMRQREHGGTAPGLAKTLVEIFPQVNEGKAREQAATMTGTNPRYVSDAKKLQADAPALLAAVRKDAW